MIVEMNEGAKRANDKMHQQSVKNKLDAILFELRILNDLIEKLCEAKVNTDGLADDDQGDSPASWRGEGVA